MQRIEFRAMGCQILGILEHQEHHQASAAHYLAQLPDWFEAWEQLLSRFRRDSELSRLNQQAGKAVRVSQVMWEVVQEAIYAAHRSNGLVVPTLLGALEAAGYERSFPTSRISTAPRSKMTKSLTSNEWQKIKFDEKSCTITLPAGTRLDLGGVAKGWAANQAARALAQWGGALVDAGGDIAISGPMSNQEPWPVAIADPFARQPEPLLLLDAGGIATSGRDYRRWQQDGKWQHHIIDPRTGTPAQTDVLTATIVAPTVAEAEVAAKVVLILGSQQGLQWLEAEPLLAGVIICQDGEMIKSKKINKYLVL